VTDASQLLGLPKSNLSRLMRSMRDVGLLDDALASRGYRPGVLLLELGQSMRAARGLVAMADDLVRQICDEVGHTGYVSVLKGKEMVGLSHHVGRNLLQAGAPLGRRLPADASSTGRALLALKTDAQVHELLGGQLSLVSSHAPSTFEELFHRLALVRERGYSESFEEAGKGVAAVSVAVQKTRSGEAASLCVTYPIATVDDKDRSHTIALLLRAKADLTRVLS
jgi:DNA-binding IclR family transcriptional regulator